MNFAPICPWSAFEPLTTPSSGCRQRRINAVSPDHWNLYGDSPGHGGHSCRAWLACVCHDEKFGKKGLLEQALKEAGVQNGVEIEQLDVACVASEQRSGNTTAHLKAEAKAVQTARTLKKCSWSLLEKSGDRSST